MQIPSEYPPPQSPLARGQWQGSQPACASPPDVDRGRLRKRPFRSGWSPGLRFVMVRPEVKAKSANPQINICNGTWSAAKHRLFILCTDNHQSGPVCNRKRKSWGSVLKLRPISFLGELKSPFQGSVHVSKSCDLCVQHRQEDKYTRSHPSRKAICAEVPEHTLPNDKLAMWK